MKQSRRAPLRLERLEDRFCPSLASTYIASTQSLTISGTPTGAGSANGLYILGQGGNTFKIMDGSTTVTTRAIANLTLNLTNHQDEAINIDLNGSSIPGNVTINLGAGDTSGAATNGIGLYDPTGTPGQIGGSVTITGGSGGESILPGLIPTSGAPSYLRVGGNFVVNAKAGGTASSVFDQVATNSGAGGNSTVSIGGAMQLSAVDGVILTPNVTIGKGLSISAAGERPLAVDLESGSVINGGLTFTGSTQTALNFLGMTGDFVDLDGTINGGVQITSPGHGPATITLDTDSIVSGTTTITAANGADSVTLQGTSLTGTTTINTGSGSTVTISTPVSGNTTINTSSGNNTLDVTTNIFGNLSFGLGSGNDTISLSGGGVFGNLTISQSGNGSDSFTLGDTVSNVLRVTLGNGNDTLTATTAPSGIFYLTAGSGNDSVSLAPTANNSVWNVNFSFGNGNDTLNLSDAGGTGSILEGSLSAGTGTSTITGGTTWTDNTYYENF